MREVEPTRKRLEWASDIPPDWDVVNLRMLARIFAGGTPDRKNTDYWTDGTVPWLNSGSVNDWAIWTPSELISGAALANGATRWAPKGSVLVALAGQGKTKGMAARLEIDSTLNQSLAAIVPGPSLEYRFLQYWLTSNYGNIRGLAGGDLRDGLNLQHIGSIQVPRPPVEEQRAIADYLDRETAQIDAFIAKNEELITLLTERRAAVASRSMDRGFPDVSVRHMVRLIQTGPFGSQLHAEDYVPGGNPLINPMHMIEGRAVPSTDIAISDEKADELRRHQLWTDDLVVARRGELGRSALITKGEVGFLCGTGSMLVRPDSRRVVARYLQLAIGSERSRATLREQSVGSTMENLNAGALSALRVPLPPIDTQREILRELDTSNARIDEALATARRSIDLARERRAALISAAVTGKINVEVAA